MSLRTDKFQPAQEVENNRVGLTFDANTGRLSVSICFNSFQTNRRRPAVRCVLRFGHLAAIDYNNAAEPPLSGDSVYLFGVSAELPTKSIAYIKPGHEYDKVAGVVCN